MRLAIVVQRFDTAISGGAEEHAHLLARHLQAEHEIEIVTTCALNYDTWRNELTPSTTSIDGIKVHRFPTDFEKDKEMFDSLTEYLIENPHNSIEELEWLVHQGPYSSSLFNFIESKKHDFDYFIFYTYLYVLAVQGLALVPEKSILIPTAHDEPVIHFPIYRSLFHLPRGIFFLTEEERDFIFRTFHNDYVPHACLGFGIEPPHQTSEERFRTRFSVNTPYILYVGRVDEGKGCGELVQYFKSFIAESQNEDVTLVLMGKRHMAEVSHQRIVMTGFVSEEDKEDALSGALAVVSPSRFESLSILVLDAFNHGKPVLAHGISEVVKGHCLKSSAGLIYYNQEEFSKQLHVIINDQEFRKSAEEKAKAYIDGNYRWKNVLQEFHLLFEKINRSKGEH